MVLASSSYEVHVYQQDHWVLDNRLDTEAEARAYARRILSGGRIEGVRVVRDWARPDGRHTETEIHQEFRGQSTAILVAPMDEAPPLCHDSAGVLSVDGRIVVNRLLRHYIDRAVLTPTELLHNHAELKRLRDKDNLFVSAVGRVAALQAERARTDARARRDELYAILDGVSERARAAAARTDLPALGSAGFGGAYDALARSAKPEDRDFLGRVLLARELVQMRNWLAKLDFLGELVREEGGLADGPLALVDGVIADVMGAPSVAQELLGRQGSMAEALCNLIDLSRGRLDVTGRPDDDRAVQLNELLAFHDLTDTRHALLDLVRRQLRGTQPLHRQDPRREREAFAELLSRALTPSGPVGDGPMAEALVLRCLRFQEAGGAPGRRRAMEETVGAIPDAADALRFLLALSQSDLGRQHAEDVARLFDKAVGDPAAFHRFVRRGDPIKANLERLTGLYRQVVESGMPEPLRGRTAGRLDDLLVAYIRDNHVVERLDDPADPLRHRANRLMQLCAPGTLRSPKALALLRERAIGHLRQPRFEETYVADLADPALRQAALREFHRLLAQAGLV